MGIFVVKADEKRGERSIRQFCRDLGINHSLWSRILRGDRTPSADVIAALLARYPELGHWLVEDAKAKAAHGKEEPAA